MFKKAQAAMEFLMTYGWAILVVLVAIGALAYFGVLSPDRFLPERCSGPSGLDCLDKASINSTHVVIVVKNNLGFTINHVNITDGTEDCPDPSNMGYAENSTGLFTEMNQVYNVSNGRKIRFEVNCGTIDEGRFKSDFTVGYTNRETGLQHEGSLQITGVSQ